MQVLKRSVTYYIQRKENMPEMVGFKQTMHTGKRGD
jgi:hypothetical protein